MRCDECSDEAIHFKFIPADDANNGSPGYIYAECDEHGAPGYGDSLTKDEYTVLAVEFALNNWFIK